MPNLGSAGRAGRAGVPQFRGEPAMGDLDRPRGFAEPSPLQVGVPVKLGSFAEPRDPRKRHGRIHPENLDGYREAAMSLLVDDDGYFWSRFQLIDNQFAVAASRVEEAISAWPDWRAHYRSVLNAMGGGTIDAQNVMSRLLTSVGGFADPPTVVTISSSRRVQATDDLEPDWLSGRGIIRALAAIQNPPHSSWEESAPRWRAINEFVRAVLGDPNASLNVPFDYSTIQVETPQRVLPLASLGSGVEQVIVLAAAATVTSRSLVCLEEPETNLHPLLQKKLVRYLTDETDNQYVIATHSSHLLDDARANAYHIRLTVKGSVATLARRPHELVQICNDLGYRPSDLLQANCVIWVEGPSDRIYVRRWLELVDPNLKEGIDYSVMFYGGKLLSHLTVDQQALEDFISLRHLNRASAVLIDSDKTGSRKKISATKARIRDEFLNDQPAPGLAWITKCYTVENYIPIDVLKAAVQTVHSTATLESFDQWQNPLPKRAGGAAYDKVGIAHAAAPLLQPDHLNTFDLRTQLLALQQFIHRANGQTVAPDADV
ncbi:AAA family ATPase [Cellulomonas sp. ATA003]|uniref:ATP-dependent nuclease n=1 Tax=Cellulomonas sp. ATA003 TaxID=3073064 RepID=UPI002873720B|nr:AAA family ATPase [Cellulomonas sp. ATA003]WNB86687.1 AAA family ATPase [Cellulomonas sp. ATA003]